MTNAMQELNFRAWCQSEGVQPTDAMRQMWFNPKGYDTGGVVGDDPVDPRFTYPFPFDPNNGAASRNRKMPWSTEPGGGLDFLGSDTFEKGVQNIMAAAKAAMKVPWVKASGETWYKAAYDWVEYMLRATGSDMEIDRAIAIVAELSRNTDWWTNMMRFRRFLSNDLAISGDPYAVGNELYGVVNRIANPQLTPDPMGAISGQKPHNFGWSIKRAGTDFTEPALIKPEEFGDPVAMDRWAKRIAMGVSDQPDVIPPGFENPGGKSKSLYDLVDALQSKGEYPSPTGVGKWSKAFDLMADMYREAARRLGMQATDMLQSLVWVYEGPTKDMQVRSADPTIKRFMETGEWKFPLTDEDIADMIIDEVKRNPDGFTFDVTGETPKTGMAYSPDKTTEFKLKPGELSKEDIIRYIREHPRMWLKGAGGHIGGRVDEEGRLTLDVSKVDEVTTKLIAAAQKAQQDATWDFERNSQLNVGYTDANGEYHTLGKPKELLQEHLAGKPPRQPPKPAAAPEPEPAPKPPAAEPKPLPKGKLKPLRERELPHPPGAGPGSAMEMPKMPLGEVLGKVLGPGMFGTSEDELQAVPKRGPDGKLLRDKDGNLVPPDLQHGDGTPYQGAAGESKKELEDLGKSLTEIATGGAAATGGGNDPAWENWSMGRGPRPPGPIPPGISPPGQVNAGPVKPGTTPTPPPAPKSKPTAVSPNVNAWWGVQLNDQVVVRHANGSPPSYYRMHQTGPNSYEVPSNIPLSPGDSIYLNGKRIR